jgi:benzoate-CoA ligase family protein
MTLIPPYFNLFDYFLGEDRLATSGNRTAIEFRGARLTYDELRREVGFWAEHILACGIAEGDRVALLLYDSPEFIAVFLASVSVGAVAVPINTFLSPEEVTFIISDSGARLVISEDELEWKVNISNPTATEKCNVILVDTEARQYLDPKDAIAPRAQLPATTRESPAFLLYTSGSTGAPKGVLHLHGAIPVTVETYGRSVLGLTSDDRVFSASRLFFAYGLGNSLSFPLSAGATVLLESVRPTPERLAALFEEQMPTVFFGVPALYNALLDIASRGRRIDTSSIRLCVSAGESLPARIEQDWEQKFNLPILDGIGSTEMLHIFISNREGEVRAGSSGRIVEGYEARLADDLGAEIETAEIETAEIETDEPGNLFVRGESRTAGYWKRPDLTEQMIKDGWVKTGDIYRKDTEGYYFHVGRSDDCFKVKGLWVSPVEVESALLAHNSVAEAAVVSSIDAAGLATARAYVVIRPSGGQPSTGAHAEGDEALKEELLRFLSSKLPSHKVPSQVEFISELPRTSTGKVQRFKLRAGRVGGSDEG